MSLVAPHWEATVESLVGMLMQVERDARDAIQREKQRFARMADEIQPFVWMSDAFGQATFCSRKYLEYIGSSDLEEFTAKWILHLHPEDQEEVAHCWKLAMRTGSDYCAEYRMRRTDGTYRCFLAFARPVKDKQGQVLRWVGVAKDVDEERLAEMQRQKDAKLTVVQTLASSIAHEIGNPLEAVTNALFLALQDGALVAGTREYLEMAEEQVTRAGNAVTHGLHYTQASGTTELTDLGEVVRSAIHLHGARVSANSIRVLKDFRTKRKIWCCRSELVVVFSNLLCNALDALSLGGRIRVRVSNAPVCFGGAWVRGVRVLIADDGEGISPEVMRHVFEPFFTTRGERRAGLALWISEQIIRKHHGAIRFRSRTGVRQHGTVVSVLLPAEVMRDKHEC